MDKNWIYSEELEILHKMSQGKNLCVDLGTGWGYSALAMSLGSDRVVTIDLFGQGSKEINGLMADCRSCATYDEVKQKLMHRSNIEVVQGLTYESLESCQDVDLLFIDGSHSYNAVSADFNAWWRKVKQGGLIIFHDSSNVHPEVQKFVKEVEDSNFKLVRHKDKEIRSLAVFEKMAKYDLDKYYSGEYNPGPHLVKVREDHEVSFSIMSLEELVNKALFIDGECIRHDVIIRFIFIERYMTDKTVDPLYEKLQRRRMATMAQGRDVKYNPKRLINLIDAFEKDGFSPFTPIILGLNEQIIEGAHRLACCIYFNINPIPIEKWSDMSSSKEKGGWFIQNFTEEELKIIEEKKEELYEQFCGA